MWLSAAFVTAAAQAEAFSDALLAQGALSVGIEDADAGTDDEHAQFGEPGCPNTPRWARCRVVALFVAGADVAGLAAAAARAAGLGETPPYELSEVAEQDWVRLTQSQFEPLRIDERLWIVPSWHEPPNPQAINLVLDPGIAFGTGAHPTTRLCLEWLCVQVTPGASVLDYGCGSGILAIAAARLGAARVTAVDIDADALAAAADNAARNGVTLELLHPDQPLGTSYDIVVANILTNPLCALAPLLTARTRPGGRLALSGILTGQWERVRQAYRPAFDLTLRAQRDGWALLTGRRQC